MNRQLAILRGVALAILLLAPAAHADLAPLPACSQGETGAPITATDEVRWPDVAGPMRIEVLGNDYDLEGDPLAVTNVTAPGVGSTAITADGRAVTFTPPAVKPAGDVTFSYTASDGEHSSTATVRVLVGGGPGPGPGLRLDLSVSCDDLNCYYKATPVGFSDVRSYRWDFPSFPGCNKSEWRGQTLFCAFTQPGSQKAVVTAYRYNGESYGSELTYDVQLKNGDARWSLDNPSEGSVTTSESLDVGVRVDFSPWSTCDNCTHTVNFGEGPDVTVSKYYLAWQGGTAYYIYSKPGIYTVTLKVAGTSKTWSKQIDVRNKAPWFTQFDIGHPYLGQEDNMRLVLEARDEHSPSGVGGDPTGPGPMAPKAVDIDWGDGTSVSAEPPWGGRPYDHRYSRPGTYTVIARITDTAGATGVASGQVTIQNVPPIPALAFDCSPFTKMCTFDASGSTDSGGSIVSYQFWFKPASGTGFIWQLTTPRLEVDLGATDEWTLDLTIKDNQGLSVLKSVPIRFAMWPGDALSYYAMPPQRVLDTRGDGVRLSPTAPRTIDLLACCGLNLPGNATAIFDITAIDPESPGADYYPQDITVAPGTALSGAVPLMRFNGVLAPISGNGVVATSGGKFTLGVTGYSTYGTHVVVDLVGILAPSTFTPPATVTGPNVFVPVEPCRALDTRFAPPGVSAGVDRKLKLRGLCGVGDDAVAMTGGYAGINPTATTPVNVFASNLAGGNGTWALHLLAGLNRGNGIWPVLGRTATDDLTLRVGTGTSDLIVDTSGYFRPAAAGGLRYVAIKPCLAGSFYMQTGQQKTVKVAGNCGVPPNAEAAVITHRLSTPYYNGHVILYGSYREPPVTSNGNYSANPANGYASSTSVVKLNPDADGDLAMIANYNSVLPSSPPINPYVSAEAWVLGYFWDENYPPAAAFNAQCTPRANTGPLCTFDATASTDDRSAIAEYRWDWGDGTTAAATSPVTTHAFNYNAAYTVKLKAWDGVSESRPVSKSVNLNTAPSARFTFDCWDATCRFDATGSSDPDGTIARYSWQFTPTLNPTDGPAVTSYTFAAAGDYTVTLTVVDDRNGSASMTRVVQVRTAAQSGPSSFFTVPQCRLYDSTSNVAGGSIAARGTACGLPAGSDPLVAVLNVTIVTSDAGSGTLTLGRDLPLQFTSTALPLGFHRQVLVLGNETAVPFTISPAARVIADVVGYYRASDAAQPAPAQGPFRFTPIDPCRVIDSRVTPPALAAATRLDIGIAGQCGIPAGAAASAQAITAINPQTSPFNGHIRAFPADVTTLPGTSMINIQHALTRSNFFVTGLGTANGAPRDLALWLSTGTSDFAIDAYGYYSASSKQKYTQLPSPVALKETPTALQTGVKKLFKVKGQGGVPMHATAAVVQADVVNPATAGYLTLFAGDKPQPVAVASTFNAGVTTPVTDTVIVPLSKANDGDLAAVSLGGGTLSLTVLGYFSDPGDWGPDPVTIDWKATNPSGTRVDVDVTAISIDPLSPNHRYYVDWGDGSAVWNEQNGSDLLGATPTHTYASTGERDVTLAVVRRSDGAVVKFTKHLRSGNTPPVASVVFDCTYTPVCSFDASASTDDYNEIQRYTWLIGGSSSQTTTPSFSYTFPGEGTYEIAVKAWDGFNESDPAYRTLQVRVPGPKTQYLFQPIKPCRVFDSRTTAPLVNGVATNVKVTEGTCGVPTTAKAVALAAAVVSPSGDGYLRIHEPNKATVVANITFSPATSPRSNHATTAIAADGNVGLTPTVAGTGATAGTVHVILDVTGYYVAEGTGIVASQGVGFRTLGPCRIRDSRFTSPPSPLTSGTPSMLKLRGNCGIPDVLPTEGLAAAALNLTAITSPTVGNLVMIPSDGTDSTSTSTVNLVAGLTTAGGTAMGLSRRASDDVTLRFVSTAPGNTIHYVIDTTGYWANGNELRYYPLPGCRMLDTRVAGFGYPRATRGVEYRVQARGQCGVPRWAKAIMVNSTVVGGESGGNLVLWPAGAPLPVASTVNWSAGEPAIGNTTIVPLGVSYPDTSFMTQFSGGHLVLDVFGYFANPADVPPGYFGQ